MQMRSNYGLTLVEVMMAVVIGGLVLAAIGLIVTRVFSLQPRQVEQGRITAEARVEMDRMSDAIRNARNGGFFGRWLLIARSDQIIITSNIDGDSDLEVVRYFLSGTTLYRWVMGSDPETLSVSFRNTEQNVPLFTYYSLGGGNALEVDPTNSGLEVIDRVGINFVIDVDPNQDPGPVRLNTVVAPLEGG